MSMRSETFVRSITRHPNTVKNRIPAAGEADALRRMIQGSEERLVELDSEINGLESSAKEYRVKAKKMNSILQMARNLQSSAEFTISSLEKIELERSWEDTFDVMDCIDDFTRPAHSQLYQDDKNLKETHEAHLLAARSALSRASLHTTQVEEDIDANHSLLFYVEESLATLIAQRDGITSQIQRMKDLIGAYRRTPNELWLQIFEERMNEDECNYMGGTREKIPPFTVLKLTWVCRKWRVLIMSRPSLWRYIPIPNSRRIPFKECERIKHCLEHLKLYPPTVYMVRWYNDTREGKFPLSSVLKQIPFFKLLDLYVSVHDAHTENLIKEVQPRAEHLVLFSDLTDDGVDAYLAPVGIQNVQNISCIDIQPKIDGETEPLNIRSLHITQSYVDNDYLVAFLQDTSVSTVTIKTRFPFDVSEYPTLTDVTLSNLTTLAANLTILATVFNDHVFLPNLLTLTVIQQATIPHAQTRMYWTSFLTTHQRKDTISTLGISGSSSIEQLEATETYQGFIYQVTKLEHLVLEGGAAVLGLEAMVAAKHIPANLSKLTIFKSNEVKKDHTDALWKILHPTQRQRLLLRIEDCPVLSDRSKEQSISEYYAPLMTEEGQK